MMMMMTMTMPRYAVTMCRSICNTRGIPMIARKAFFATLEFIFSDLVTSEFDVQLHFLEISHRENLMQI